ncbi:uncharacterized protein M6B38_260055 [Iris pallida]|uniref:FLZ-type domain-containing protein n=1 Tax=Iris pallida TaxID=29817 RepID=A0AAX6IEH7_IRIPA|nr:uncharacterized protein M6B38_260055 [Iris pallida]
MDHLQQHFLDRCFLCKKAFAAGDDMYMYRGDAPFCSEGCRKEQMDTDAAEERMRNKQRKKKMMRRMMMMMSASTEEEKSSNSSIFSSDEKLVFVS